MRHCFSRTTASLFLAASALILNAGCKTASVAGNSNILGSETNLKLDAVDSKIIYFALQAYAIAPKRTSLPGSFSEEFTVAAESVGCESSTKCNVTAGGSSVSEPNENPSEPAQSGSTQKMYEIFKTNLVYSVTCLRRPTSGQQYSCSYKKSPDSASGQPSVDPARPNNKPVTITGKDAETIFKTIKDAGAEMVSGPFTIYKVVGVNCINAQSCIVTTESSPKKLTAAKAKGLYAALAKGLGSNGAINTGTVSCDDGDFANPKFTCSVSKAKASVPTNKSACQLVCEGRISSCVNTTRENCIDAKKYELFGSVPRCPHQLEFHEGERCGQ